MMIIIAPNQHLSTEDPTCPIFLKRRELQKTLISCSPTDLPESPDSPELPESLDLPGSPESLDLPGSPESPDSPEWQNYSLIIKL